MTLLKNVPTVLFTWNVQEENGKVRRIKKGHFVQAKNGNINTWMYLQDSWKDAMKNYKTTQTVHKLYQIAYS